MFRIWFDEAPKTGADLGGSPVSPVPEGLQVSSSGEIKLDLAAAEKRITEAFGSEEEKAALKTDKKEVKETEEAEDETEEASDTTDDSEDTDDSDDDNEEEEVVDEDDLDDENEKAEDSDTDDSEKEVPQTISKRLKDTQAAFHAERKKNREYEERIAKLEAKINGKTDEAQDGGKEKGKEKTTELTLANVDPKVLEEALKKDPINTTRWIADQQVKLSQQRAAEEQKVKNQQTEFETRYKQSEEAATKRFPVIQKVLKMSDEQLASFKSQHPEQYEFAQKAAQYWKDFNARGDVDALYNAASRAYADLSPKTLKKIREESKQLGKQEATTKTKILGKLRVEESTGTKPKSGSGFRTLSSEEFSKLSHADQKKHMEQSVEARFSRLAK
jgi:hypothetical protein